jgi:lysophospholipid acyltransferase (LPLAT)-like uncharacterized protein
MKLRHPLAIKSAAFAISLWVRGWMGTMRIQERFLCPDFLCRNANHRAVFLFWHEALLLPTYAYTKFEVSTLISNHRDGELVAQVVHFMGGETIRGSTTRGGSAALRAMLQEVRERHVAITPDGPRGPRRVVQPGAVFLASHAQIPVVPVGIHMPGAWRAKSWDRMAIPKPFRRAYVVFGNPIHVPPNISRDDIEHYRQLCQQGMDQMQGMAEAWEHGDEPAPATPRSGVGGA